MSFSRTHFSLISIIFTFQSSLPTLLAIITQDSERSLYTILIYHIPAYLQMKYTLTIPKDFMETRLQYICVDQTGEAGKKLSVMEKQKSRYDVDFVRLRKYF